ncbi:hypothetical protein EXU57_13665 [Segetibacter sp. 3557_3]|uniref:hypothetical protein n=1 Tax=Segetibacter sp. 3557_3 TaxID=2547429 RepID=UPI00105850DF|nr:hypothetical protein [Segetibacter sp. 3557_3]TDH25152.1 hypothetical protein EXU57_13665 [Segetibacter sp. 3557_3]
MKYLFLVFFLISTATLAQRDSLHGVYSLEGVQETASVFQLNPDSTFEFFYSYGALDRYGKGKWRLEQNEVVLTGEPYPGKDFKMVGSSMAPVKGMVLRLKDKNPVFNNFFYARVKTTKGDTIIKADRTGTIRLPKVVSTIDLLFELTPEKISPFTLPKSTHNQFTFAFEPWIAEVFFSRFRLQMNNGDLQGKHPLLTGERYRYGKIHNQ